jgi:hypothetical protein
MRKLAAVLLTAAFATLVPVPAFAQCGLFSTEGKCPGPTGPRLSVDFGAGIAWDAPARLQTTRPPLMRQPPASSSPAPIDCQMVRGADPTVDPGLVMRPPEGVKFMMRVIEVPACPAQ